jgi:hypothetical protein
MDVHGEYMPVLQPQFLAHVGEHLSKVPRSLVHLGLRPMHSHRIRKRQPHVVRKVRNRSVTALPESPQHRSKVHPVANHVVWRTLLGARKVLTVAPPARLRVQGLFGIWGQGFEMSVTGNIGVSSCITQGLVSSV